MTDCPRVTRATQSPPSGSIQAAIKQTRPFPTKGQEALVGLMLTAESVRWAIDEVMTSQQGLTRQQYNVLRILRGAGTGGLPTLEIGDRMIERTPGITRLIDRLEGKGLVERTRCTEDRRQVLCQLTAKGAAAIAELEKPLRARERRIMSGLSETEITRLIRLLDRVRNNIGAPR